jgi:hypothetical protein
MDWAQSATEAPSAAPPEPQVAHGIESRVATLSYHGGLIGALTGGMQRRKLESTIAAYNQKGYRLAHVLPPKSGILFHLVGLVCLFLTLLLWAPQPGETLIFERPRPDASRVPVTTVPALIPADGEASPGHTVSRIDVRRLAPAAGQVLLYGLLVAVVIGVVWLLMGSTVPALLPFIYTVL